jgi:hypothetical protein
MNRNEDAGRAVANMVQFAPALRISNFPLLRPSPFRCKEDLIRYSRIEPNNVLNLCCEQGSSLESILRRKTHKILFRQHRSKADLTRRRDPSGELRD